jgi:hypothetical protein
LIEEIDAICSNPRPNFEIALVYYEQLDRLFAAAIARRDNVLDRIES